MKANDEGTLVEEVRGMLKKCGEAGFSAPLYCVMLAANGAMHYVRYDAHQEGLMPTPLAQHYESDAFELPVNIVVTDASGNAARMLIESDGERRFTVLH